MTTHHCNFTKTHEEILKANAHISEDEIEDDIKDTEVEIVQMEREATGLELIGDKLSCYKADARRHGIEERKEFIKKLEHLLELRRKKDGIL